jgi:hypothetical protein
MKILINNLPMKSKVFLLLFLFLTSQIVHAGFVWTEPSGSGNFQQQIEKNKVVEVGEIPAGLKNVVITLRSDEDVDIQLIDKTSGDEIISWPDGFLQDATRQTIRYRGLDIVWSGFDGDGTGLGHEYITISGWSNRDFIMRAFGYVAGYAEVDYSWEGNTGSGSFEQQIDLAAVVDVGEIPAGLENISVTLTSPEDVDIQLFDQTNDYKVIGYPDGRFNEHDEEHWTYEGNDIEYSGYEGDQTITGWGHEWIRITNISNRAFFMKAYGWKAGYAVVDYSWGYYFSPTADEDEDGVWDYLEMYEKNTLDGTDLTEPMLVFSADWDSDGVWDVDDAFPFDDTESVDTDGDGIGNNADTDDDNDGVLDINDDYPLDPNESVNADIPITTLSTPLDGLVTTEPEQIIRGFISKSAVLTINGVAVNVYSKEEHTLNMGVEASTTNLRSLSVVIDSVTGSYDVYGGLLISENDNSFIHEITLSPGVNIITMIAIDTSGNSSETTITMTLN